jgi:hypothetical protein
VALQTKEECMNKRAMVLSFLVIAALPCAFGDIGENYSKGGFGLSGSFSIFNDFYYFMDSAEKRNYWNIDIAPGVEYFVADRLSLQLSPWYYHSETKQDSDNIDRYTDWGLRFGANYALIIDPAAQQGFVVTVGGFIGFAVYPTVDDLIAGVETAGNNDRTELQIGVTPRAYYFFNDRVAAYLGITPRLSYIIGYKDPSGTTIDLTGNQRFHADITLMVGIAFFVPNQKASILSNK